MLFVILLISTLPGFGQASAARKENYFTMLIFSD